MPRLGVDLVAPVRTVNAQGKSPFVLVCDHASNRIPPAYANLGLSAADRLRHVAWDPGALAVSLRLTELLDAPLLHATASRLVIDCNRHLDSPTAIAELSEITAIPGNIGISAADRAERTARYHAPFHEAIDRLLAQRQAAGRDSILVCMHSFTPVYLGVKRPWPIGILPPPGERFSAALFEALAGELPGMALGWNQPYAGGKGVSYTVDRHGEGRDATMIEIRHDEILEPNGVALWADRLARCLEAARVALHGASAHLSSPLRGGIALEGRD
ncbi:MAG: N-formylglutamate amidohydrolase [Devosia sp.]